MLVDQGSDKVFCFRRQDKVLERFVIPLKGVDMVDVETDCLYVSLK